MERFTSSIRKSIDTENWFAALFLALCMPDICASIETPKNENVGERYKRWFTDNLASTYSPMFSAEDCYYFRCSCLHQGLDNHKKLVHERIHFIPPLPNGNIVHRNKMGKFLQMQIDIFCNDVANAVDLWYENVAKKDVDMKERVESLIRIYGLESLAPFMVFK